MIRLLPALAATLWLATAPMAILAQTPADRDAAMAAVTDFRTAFEAGDLEGVLDAMPDALLDHIAKSSNMAPADARAEVLAQMSQEMEAVTVESVTMDLDEARGGISPADRPYFVISTETIMRVPSRDRLRAVSDTLVLEDGGSWYLMRVETDESRSILASIYPDLAGVDFADGVVEPAP